jgi:ATP-dependent DNA ligase
MFIYPPRPCGKIPAGFLRKKYTPPFWCAQRKFNGTRNCVDIGEGEVKLWTRHGTPNKRFDMPKSMKDQFLSLGISNSYLDGELLHSKTKNIKGKIVLFDILKYSGSDLFLSGQKDRINLLDKICNHPKEYIEFKGINLALANKSKKI